MAPGTEHAAVEDLFHSSLYLPAFLSRERGAGSPEAYDLDLRLHYPALHCPLVG